MKRATSAPKRAPAQRRGKATAAKPPPLVLVVDDYADAREMYCEYLQFRGFRTVEAKTGIEALVEAASALPDVILMDLSLPEMDGWEAMAALRADPGTATFPVIACTASAPDPARIQAAGFRGCIPKPTRLPALVEAIRRYGEAHTG